MAVLVFDLDGTLVDTGPFAVEAYRRVLKAFQYEGVQCPTEEEILKTFGLPDTEIWAKLMPRHSVIEQRQGFLQAGQFIREAIMENEILLPHAKEVIETLHERGHTLTTASNCGQEYLDVILETQGIGHLFDHPLCLETVNGLKKEDILKAQIERFGEDGLVMIGDRYTDAEAAKAVGMPFVACDFGFGHPSELEGAQITIQTLPELLQHFA